VLRLLNVQSQKALARGRFCHVILLNAKDNLFADEGQAIRVSGQLLRLRSEAEEFSYEGL